MRDTRPNPRSDRRRARLAAVASAALLSLLAGASPAGAAAAPPSATATASAASTATPLDRKALRASLEAFHQAGMYGAYSSVRDSSERWRGAVGVADIDTGRPMRPDYEHRIGSITKTFTSVAVLQQVAEGRIGLDAPIGDYLPDLVPGERGRKVTVRMLLNHTSGIADYILPAFPGLVTDPGQALDEGRFRELVPEELVRLGLAAEPPAPRGTHAYANTNYLIAGLLLEKVTGQDPEAYITENVIRRAGLRHTYFPRSARIPGPHARMYESFYGTIAPARDYSVYDMSWAGTAGAMVSTTDDLNDFYRRLLGGKLLGAAELREMKTTVPAYEPAPGQEVAMRYGLGLYTLKMPGGDWYWGHDGGVFGAGTWALSTEDGRRQAAIGYNLMKYERFGEDGTPLPDPIGSALFGHMDGALSGAPAERAPGASPVPQRLVAPEQLR
ncbi:MULTISPECIES: serine hydrolase domain-containing protein [unclassified Streptomyces]|uniref:serine hydrolase domain-containing protein n=2 Tax=Streptomyces TaxID=1883 RepID=UPI00081B9E3E|nr:MULTISPECIES: serine hydrolase domain-containing protein [unclassified Streptomyces]MYQ55191.1 serine hydrolase [Streptomyces sp. SID4941]SCE34040.1 D-alanyl-D-alanine carboxypeptidase [Streptomyces sp. PalvLS-984]SDD78771.1 D-alanyl-D-alanine carboxypeptidase [Streptomyces sp. AmelKG-A3]